MIDVKVKKLVSTAVIPFYSKDGDMGMDVVATSIEFDAKIDCYIYHTGLSFEVPKGYGMFLFPRSSNRKKDVYLPNSVGILDSGYRGELLFSYKNRDASTYPYGVTPPYNVGDKVGQLVIMPYPQINFVETDKLSNSERGEGGFGSTRR